MIKGRKCIILAGAIVSLLSMSGSTSARTLRVARDGTGDYTVLLDATLAAASGDTISIGPGEYTEAGPAEGWLRDVFAAVPKGMELSLIGDDPDVVVIGPVVPAADLEREAPCGLCADIGSIMHVENVTVRHMSTGINAGNDRLTVRNSVFVNCDVGVSGSPLYETDVRGCTFVGNVGDGILIFGNAGSTGIIIEDCHFQATRGAGIDLQTQGNVIRNCTFEGDGLAIQFSFAASGIIDSCTLSNMPSIGIGLTGGSRGTITNCVIEGGYKNILVSGGALLGSGNILMGGSVVTLEIMGSPIVQFNGNHIFNGGGLSARSSTAYRDPPVIHDLTNNYWGTVDRDQISAWILDGNDSPNAYAFIEFEPFFDHPVSAEETTFGEVKARFGQRE